MVKNFSKSENAVLSYFSIGDQVCFQERSFWVEKVGKPTCSHGEPKTDVYLLLKNENEQKEIKISYKKSNADFLENKIRADRAELLFGEKWQEIIQSATEQLKEKFLSKPLIFKEAFKRTEQGAITLGWKFELMNKVSGALSGKIQLSKEQCFDVYAGSNLPEDKRHASIEDEIIINSGVANYFLTGNYFDSANDVLGKIQPIEDYVEKYPEIYFACKALNYRTCLEREKKWDGNRSLSVQVSWEIKNGKLTPTLVFDRPLKWNGDDVAEQLKQCLEQLKIRNMADINNKNTERSCIYE